MSLALLLTVFVIATCGLVYELVASTIASYLLGDSVTQFSTVIGTYLFAMGIGSYLSRFIHRQLIVTFIQVEMLIALVGGTSAAVLFLAFEWVADFRVLLYGLVALIGALVGMEIPLMMRMLQNRMAFKDLVSQVFTFDYVGALAASLLFPLLLVPHLGLMRTALLFGLLNLAVAFWTIHLFRHELVAAKWLRTTGALLMAVLIAGWVYADRLMSLAEQASYPDPVIYAKSTPYQRIVLTRAAHDTRLFLNGNLQFSSRDEYRYHEALVHPAMAAIHQPKRALVLGGGDGLAVREILKYPSIQQIVLVELDPTIGTLFKTHPHLQQLNQHAFQSPKVTVIPADAFVWLNQNTAQFDFIAIDFPDPNNFSLGKLYSDTFYRRVVRALAPEGRLVVQSTSPFYAPESFGCIVNTLASVGLAVRPYHAVVPAFGDWGFILAGHHWPALPDRLPDGLKFLTLQGLPGLFDMPPDMRAKNHDINQLQNQKLVHYFEREWAAVAAAH